MDRGRKRPGPIHESLRHDSLLKKFLQRGIQALSGTDKAAVDRPIRSSFADSLNLDEAFRRSQPTEPRWDYLLGVKNTRKVIGLEVHEANDAQVEAIIRKKLAAEDALGQHLAPTACVEEWFWAASGKVRLSHGRKRHLLQQNGIRFVGKRLRKEHIQEGRRGD